jgi:hypothetical protein
VGKAEISVNNASQRSGPESYLRIVLDNHPHFLTKETMIDIFEKEGMVKVRGVFGKLIKYVGSNLFRVRYEEGNKTVNRVIDEKDIDFLGQDIEYLRKAYR